MEQEKTTSYLKNFQSQVHNSQCSVNRTTGGANMGIVLLFNLFIDLRLICRRHLQRTSCKAIPARATTNYKRRRRRCRNDVMTSAASAPTRTSARASQLEESCLCFKCAQFPTHASVLAAFRPQHQESISRSQKKGEVSIKTVKAVIIKPRPVFYWRSE